jgi:multiple sugar transport system ATP-binding protein
MAFLSLNGIKKYFDAHCAIKGIDLEIERGEFIVFVGPSGCGKSTLLRLIAGLENIDGGSLTLDGRDITSLPSSKRDLAMVFQSYALYPHMTVFENMSFALKLAGVDRETIRQKVNKAAAILNLTDYLERTPKALSGGQRQRVAIGRAIVRAPKVFLFDEPLSNLDAALRGQTRLEIARLHRELGATTIYVTHDQVEAMTLADRVVVLRDGAIEQVGTPLELYDRPANQFVAQFIGTPRMNIMPLADLPRMPASDAALPANGFIGIRPEYVEVGAMSSSSAYPAIVDVVESLGAETLIYSTLENGLQIVARRNERSDINPGDRVGLLLNQQHLHVFDPAGKVIAAQSTAASVAPSVAPAVTH